jgi:signal transduction histidine kinase
VATTDRPASASPGLGERTPGRALIARPLGGWWRGWFVPARRPLPRVVDVLVALVIAVVQVAGTMVYGQDEPSRWPFDAFAYALLVAGPVALLFRRRWPEAMLAVAFAAAAGYAASGYPRGPAGLPAFAFAVVSAIMMGRRAFAWGALALGYAAFVWLPLLIPDEVEKARSLADAAGNLVWLPLVGAASEIARSRLERRAEGAHGAREEARRRVSEERLLIARELHDVLATTSRSSTCSRGWRCTCWTSGPSRPARPGGARQRRSRARPDGNPI